MGRLGPFEENTIVVGDCLDIMAQMPDGCVDLVITDPPYNIGKDYDGYSDRLSDDAYWERYSRWIEAIWRVMADGAFYISCLPRQLWMLRPLGEDVGFKFAQLLIWYGPNLIKGTHAVNLPWTPLFEPIFMFWKGPRQRMLNVVDGLRSFDVLKFTRPQRSFGGDLHRVHVTQKPLGLYKTIIGRTPGEIVFDPFIGSGTSMVVAKRLGRTFFGCDISADCIRITHGRLDGHGPPGQLSLL